MRMTIEKAKEIKNRLESYDKLANPVPDKVGWIALAYSCSRAEADRMITESQARIAIEPSR